MAWAGLLAAPEATFVVYNRSLVVRDAILVVHEPSIHYGLLFSSVALRCATVVRDGTKVAFHGNLMVLVFTLMVQAAALVWLAMPFLWFLSHQRSR